MDLWLSFTHTVALFCQERISLMEGERSGEMKVLSPEEGIKEVEKPPQNLPFPVVSPKQQEATIKASPFSDAMAAAALGRLRFIGVAEEKIVICSKELWA